MHKKDGQGLFVMPLCYAFMKKEDEEAYKEVFEAIKSVVGTPIEMNKCHLDFEIASNTNQNSTTAVIMPIENTLTGDPKTF